MTRHQTRQHLLTTIERERRIGVDPIYANSFMIRGRGAREEASKAWCKLHAPVLQAQRRR